MLLALPFFFGFFPWVILAWVIFVPVGGPKVAVTVLSASILTWQGAVPVQAPVKPGETGAGRGFGAEYLHLAIRGSDRRN